MDDPIAQWLIWNIRAYDDMYAIVYQATLLSAIQPSSINIEEIRRLNCPIYEIFIRNGGRYHDHIYFPAFDEALVRVCCLYVIVAHSLVQ